MRPCCALAAWPAQAGRVASGNSYDLLEVALDTALSDEAFSHQKSDSGHCVCRLRPSATFIKLVPLAKLAKIAGLF